MKFKHFELTIISRRKIQIDKPLIFVSTFTKKYQIMRFIFTYPKKIKLKSRYIISRRKIQNDKPLIFVNTFTEKNQIARLNFSFILTRKKI